MLIYAAAVLGRLTWQGVINDLPHDPPAFALLVLLVGAGVLLRRIARTSESDDERSPDAAEDDAGESTARSDRAGTSRGESRREGRSRRRKRQRRNDPHHIDWIG